MSELELVERGLYNLLVSPSACIRIDVSIAQEAAHTLNLAHLVKHTNALGPQYGNGEGRIRLTVEAYLTIL